MTAPRIQLGQELGHGGMSRVYRAELDGHGPVALKCLGPMLQNLSHYERELIAEARYASHFDHPNIVRTVAFGRAVLCRPSQADELAVYSATSLVGGENLRRLMSRHHDAAAWRDGPALSLAMQVLDALAYMEESAAAPHCDVTPSNLLVSTEGDVLLCDFGLSALVARGGEDAPWLRASTLYMSPRVAAGEEASFGSDTYSVARIAWELITGINDVRGSRPPDHSAVESPARDAVADASGLNGFVRRALSPRGFATARDARDSLRSFAGERDVQVDRVKLATLAR